jgi:hypothetical protein
MLQEAVLVSEAKNERKLRCFAILRSTILLSASEVRRADGRKMAAPSPRGMSSSSKRKDCLSTT